MPNRAEGLVKDNSASPVIAPSSSAPQAASSSSNRASGLENEPATAPTLPRERSTPDVTGGAYTYDTGGGWQAALHNIAVKMNNATRVAQDATTYHAADLLQGLIPGGPSVAELRAQTDASNKDLGPYGSAAVNAAGRMANPVSWVGGGNAAAASTLGRIGNVGTMMAANALREGTAAALHGDNPTVPAVVGGLTGAAPVGLHLAQRVREPALTTLGATYFGTPGALVGQAISHAIPPPGPLSWNLSRLSQVANPALQGLLSRWYSTPKPTP